ncbi:glycoside hydrolase family 127 protein [Lentzea sp. PSKA42]|uniref:Glycoside hydrolase family 127 protein n=1 Tax=Lentzea indica TaxID=2604800 RepID=A0ABX1FLG7_9PSEU|nr:beta-L-arabinofuranosidase domain-containing protein [Lentzea indica]NKE59431.1 glycoside hydrolase family 127 protein [Lentzea indica]
MRNTQSIRGPVVPSRGPLRPLGTDEVRITGGFWAKRQQVNGEATLGHALAWMDELGWTGNFTTVANGAGSPVRKGREFSDSEVYKIVEAMSWEHGRSANDDLNARIDALTSTFAAAQAGDGYLSTAFGRDWQRPRYHDLAWGHELYCVGHLLQAAVARTRTAGDGPLLDVARRAADHVCEVFGPGSTGVCGHPEIETALVELARLTGEQRYLDQAALFVDRRGHRSLPAHEFGWSYFSDDVPVRKATVLRGHAVRALYLACGAVDVAVETGDDDLLDAVAAQFDRTWARRTHITGGMGSRHQDEAFGDDFVLPADRAYAETCAGVATVMLAQRLLLATGDSRYAGITDRVLHNVIATAIGDDGRSFFYANTLHQRTPARPNDDGERLDVGGGLRAPWFEVSCCLPNIARLLASLSSYLVTADDTGLRLHQYADCDVETRLADGRPVGIEVRTSYPEGGDVAVRVTRSGAPWSITLRVPDWATGAVLDVDHQRHPVAPGDVVLTREWAVGQEIRLELPMRPRFIRPDPRIDAVRGCVAVERGPLVLCAESLGENDLDALRVCTGHDPEQTGDGAVVRARFDAALDSSWPYGEPSARPGTPVPLHLTPYHRWARRGPSTMRVWLPTA